jgi:hypothetical protein
MKVFIFTIIASVAWLNLARAEGPVDTATNIAHDTVDTAKNVGHSVAKGTKKAAKKVEDALTPDSDARPVNVTLSDDRIDMPETAEPGKTAFVVKNGGTESHGFEVKGNGTHRKFHTDVAPNETKVLHVDLKRGTYTASCPGDSHKHGADTKLKVK